MGRFWAIRAGWRVAVAIVAAYAVALQMLLASIAPGHLLTGAINSAAEFIICHSDPAAPPESPAPSHQPDHCPPCILSLLAGALPALLGSSWFVPTATASFILTRAAALFIAPRHPTPRLSQGPPGSG